MRTKLIDSSSYTLPNYQGDTERYIYECPCGKGTIVEEHDNIPGFRDHSVDMYCDKCKEKYEFDLSKGIRCWELKKKK